MNISATSRLRCQRLGVSNADFSIRWCTAFKIMNFFFVISSVLQCYSNHHQRLYLQLDTVVCKSSSLLGLQALSPPPLSLFPYRPHRVRRKRSWVLRKASFFCIILQFSPAKNSSCLSHSNLDSISELLLLQKYTGHLIQLTLLFLNCLKQHLSFQFSIAWWNIMFLLMNNVLTVEQTNL